MYYMNCISLPIRGLVNIVYMHVCIGGWHCRHVGGQKNKSKFARKVCIKLAFNSPRRKILLFLSTNMAAMTSHTNHQLKLFLEDDYWIMLSSDYLCVPVILITITAIFVANLDSYKGCCCHVMLCNLYLAL